MKNLSLAKIFSHLGLSYKGSEQVVDYQVDSRKVKAGTLFFALPGEKTDGHLYLEEVAKKGAVAAVVSEEYNGDDYGLILLHCPDVLQALQKLARKLLEKKRGEVIGVTGTVGKTTTKEFISTLLGGKYRVERSLGNQNTQIGLPLTVLNRSGEEDILVLEMAMTEKGQIKKLVDIAPLDRAVLTKISLVHIENFPEGIEGIAEAKYEIMSSSRAKLAVINSQSLPWFYKADEFTGRVISYGLSKEVKSSCDFFLEEREGKYRVGEKEEFSPYFSLPFSEPPLRENFLAAVCLCRSYSMSWEEILARIPYLKLPSMRFEKEEIGGVLWVKDMYNSNPEAMRSILACLPAPKKGGKRIGVLGSMLGFSTKVHEEIGEVAAEHLDALLCIGEESLFFKEAFIKEGKRALHFSDLQLLQKELKKWVSKGDVVLVKGSRKMELERIFEPFYDGESVR